MAQVTYTRAGDNADIHGTLFAGIKFFLAQRVPFRSTYVDKVVGNGGEVVKLEQQASIIIADHMKAKDAPPGSISWKFIDACIKSGELQDIDDDEFRCGPPKGEPRQVTSSRPARTLRLPFTAEQDLKLYQWVKRCELRGDSIRGNKIYQDFEAVNSRHTWQSWRDRYLKKLATNPPPNVASAPMMNNGPPTPPTDVRPVARKASAAKPHTPQRAQPSRPQDRLSQDPSLISKFSAADIEDLLINGDGVLNTRVRFQAQAWIDWAEDLRQTPQEWQLFWETIVHPIFEDLEGNHRRKKIYQQSFTSWCEKVPDGTAEDWQTFYVNKVKPRFEFEHENAQDIPTPQKGKRDASAKSSSTVMKRPREEEEDDDDLYNSPPPQSKRRQLAPALESIENVDDEDSEGAEGDLVEEAVISNRDDEGEDDEVAEPVEADEQARGGSAGYAEEEEDEVDFIVNPEMANPNNDEIPSSPPTNHNVTPTPLRTGDLNTQAIVDAETQEIDFDIPGPEDGEESDIQAQLRDDFSADENAILNPPSDSDPLGSESEISEHSVRHSIEIGKRGLEDQDPDESNQTAYETARETPSQLESDSSDGDESRPLYERVAALGVTGLVAAGHSRAHVATAVERTSAHPALFAMVLGSLECGNGVPRGVAGIWTEAEDIILEGGDAKGIRRLERKHGMGGVKGCVERLNFLHSFRG